MSKETVLLALLPFWSPQIPPLGISCLKSFLQPHGYRVKTVDANVDQQLRKEYDNYFSILKEAVPVENQGNFFNIGHDVMHNHMMAYIYRSDDTAYRELVKTLVAQTFFLETGDDLVQRLDDVLDRFYRGLRRYFLDLLEEVKPDVLGLSVYKGSLPASLFVFRLTRERFPRIKTVMGGAVFSQALVKGTPDFQHFLEKTEDCIDHLIVGEGEHLFLKLLEGELPGSQRVFSLADIGGRLMDLTSAPVPDFSDADNSLYPSMATYSSRSCPFQCTFCTETIYWGKYRKKPARQIVTELTGMYREYRSQLFFMCDSLLNPVVTDLSRELLSCDISVYWDGYLRVDKHTCSEDLTHLWRRGGFYRARLGIESGSPHILEKMDKRIAVSQIKSTITALANAGIKTTTYWIIGYPGETESDFCQTLDLIEELRDSIYEAECNPFRFYLSGQVNSGDWLQEHRVVPVYPGKDAERMLLLQTWGMDCAPSREETHRRISRFVEHCNTLDISNPYSLYDINKADARWKKLHKNAVPPLLEFKTKNTYIDENKKTQKIQQAAKPVNTAIEFGF